MPTKPTMMTLARPTHDLERQPRALSLSGMAQTLLARNQEASPTSWHTPSSWRC